MLNLPTTANHSSKQPTTTITTKKPHQDKPQQQTATQTEQQQDDDDENDEDEEFDEPVWDEANLKTIQLIESKYYDDLQHTTKKKLQSDSSGSKTRVTSPSTINKEHEKKKLTKKRRAPSHLDIQVTPESNNTINPTSSQAIHHLLSQRFKTLKPSSKNNGLYQRFRAKRGFLSGLSSFIL
jgi:hypothetical protein